MGLAFPKPGIVVKWLLIGNIGAFVLQMIASTAGIDLADYFGAGGWAWWQVWRYLTFQFLHGGPWHLGLNMIALYFLGVPLEAKMGPRRFLTFYLLCGAMAGVSYVLIGLLVGGEQWGTLVGASGGVYGIVLAAAVYFPHIKVLLFFMIPVPIRVIALIFFGIMLLTLFQGLGAAQFRSPAFWSQAAHFGGAVTAAIWILRERRHGLVGGRGGPSVGERIRQGQWERKMHRRQKIQQEIDGILEKIHTHGIASLSAHEKRLLKQATEMQREEEERIKRL